jgi:hypothetical protein
MPFSRDFTSVSGHAFHPPVHLVLHPQEPIRTLEDAAKVIERHGHERWRNVDVLLGRLRGARGEAEIEAAGAAFRRWAEDEGLLLVPPEDEPA